MNKSGKDTKKSGPVPRGTGALELSEFVIPPFINFINKVIVKIVIAPTPAILAKRRIPMLRLKIAGIINTARIQIHI